METEILIFRSSVTNKRDMKRIGRLFDEYPQINRWNVDLEDWEKILRIECNELKASDIIAGLKTIRIYASELI